MFLHPHNPNRNAAGSLGAIVRSTGYLQGGYKDSTINSAVQLYNTTTESGRVVYDTGYRRYYVPGVAGDLAGYYSTDDTSKFAKLSYITVTAQQNVLSIPIQPLISSCDFGVNSIAWLIAPGTNYYKLSTATDVPVAHGNLSSNPTATTRQGLSMKYCGSFINWGTNNMHTLNYETNAVVASSAFAELNTGRIQYPCGMSRSESIGHFVGYNGINVKISFIGTTISAFASDTYFSYNFGESHSLSTPTAGYMMAGYSDTTGRYGGSQHGLCQKFTFETSAISSLPDLSLPQSSGQMMQGF